MMNAEAGLFPGDTLFHIKDTHGLPLEMALDRIITDQGMAVDWVGFIQAARASGWYDFQTIKVISHALADADLPKDYREAVTQRCKLFILKEPQGALA